MGYHQTSRGNREYLYGCHSNGTSTYSSSSSFDAMTYEQAFYALVNLAAYVLEGLWTLFAPICGFRLREEPMKSKLQ